MPFRSDSTRSRTMSRVPGDIRRAIVVLLSSLMIAGSISAPAMAQILPSDMVGGYPISEGRVRAKSAPNMDVPAGVLMTSDGRVVWSRQGDQRRAMASTTKIMTGLLAIEKGRLDDYVTISAAASKTPYGIGLKAGQKVQVRKLLELALVASSNDAAYALGEHVGGTMPRFVNRMNDRAASLGLRRTHFANAHGLDAPGHYSTAANLASLARVAMKQPEFRRAVSMRSVAMPGGRVLKSTDKLLGVYPGMEGVKTGFTDDAKFSFVGAAKRGDVELYSVVLGAPNNAARFSQTRILLDWGFKHIRTQKLISADEVVGTVPLRVDRSRTVSARPRSAVSARVFDLDGPITRQTVLARRINLPVFRGQWLGEVTMMQGGRALASVRAVSRDAVASRQETVGVVPVSDYLDRSVTARAAMIEEVPEFDSTVPVAPRVELKSEVRAPVSRGDKLGDIVYVQGDREVLRVPVVADSSVEAPEFKESVRISLLRGWRQVFGGTQMAALQVDGQ